MEKLNRVIAGGAVAIAITLMAGVMQKGMATPNMQANMSQAKPTMVCHMPMNNMVTATNPGSMTNIG